MCKILSFEKKVTRHKTFLKIFSKTCFKTVLKSCTKQQGRVKAEGLFTYNHQISDFSLQSKKFSTGVKLFFFNMKKLAIAFHAEHFSDTPRKRVFFKNSFKTVLGKFFKKNFARLCKNFFLQTEKIFEF